jgi:hypothetical protein
MPKNINLYVSDNFQHPNANNIQISSMNDIVSGSCDTLYFSELETVPIENLKSFVDISINKLKLNSGKLFLSFINTARIINDAFYEKASLEMINKIVFNNPKNTNVVYEKDIISIINTISDAKIINITYDEYKINMEILRHD